MNDFRFACPGCQQVLEGDPTWAGQSVACPSCNVNFTIPNAAADQNAPRPRVAAPDNSGSTGPGIDAKRLVGQMGARIADIAGVERLQGFDVKALFADVFKKHTTDEVEDYFAVGTPNATPSIADCDTSWPRPWVFFRIFTGALLVFGGFLLAWVQYENELLLPGLILTGSFAVPLASLIFFVEMNARRNVSLYQVMRMVFLGGIISLILSSVLYAMVENMDMEWLGMSIAGLIEEPGKLLALLTVINIPRFKYKLNGLLLGAAVGAGFAAFESAGYAYVVSQSDMVGVIVSRGALAPLMHIVWTAANAAALWRVKGTAKFTFNMLLDPRFLKIFALTVGLHMVWNASFGIPLLGEQLGLLAKYALCGLVAWILVLALIQDGLKELREEKLATATAADPHA